MNKVAYTLTVLACLLLALLAASSIAAAAPNDGAKLQVTLISQEPDPANPGDVIDVKFKIENTGYGNTGNILFEIMPSYPFSVYSGDSQKNIGSLDSLQKDDNAVIVVYKLKVDQNAVEREEKIDIRYRIDDGSVSFNPSWIYVKDFVLRVRVRDLIVSAQDIKSSPDPIPPGEEAMLSLNIQNNVGSLVRDVRVKLDTSADSVPFAPSGSTMEKSIYQLEPLKSATFEFAIIAKPDAKGGVYKIPLTISYTDQTGKNYTRNDIVGLRISAKPDILATVEKAEACKVGEVCTIDVKIVNRGLTNIKLLTATLQSNHEYEVISQEEVYIGNIDSDDYETVEYKLKLNSKSEKLKVPIKLVYMDSTNQRYEETKDISFHPVNVALANSTAAQASPVLGIIIVVVIVAAGLGIFLWRRKKKKSSK